MLQKSSSGSSSHSNTSSQVSPNYSVHFLPLSFINPPESHYHVRYVSEITELPLNGSIVNTRMKNKKNLSGRYLKGLHGRYITITVCLSDKLNNLMMHIDLILAPKNAFRLLESLHTCHSSNCALSRHIIHSSLSTVLLLEKSENFPTCHFPRFIHLFQNNCR